jgi:hypothetical protein
MARSELVAGKLAVDLYDREPRAVLGSNERSQALGLDVLAAE